MAIFIIAIIILGLVTLASMSIPASGFLIFLLLALIFGFGGRRA